MELVRLRLAHQIAFRGIVCYVQTRFYSRRGAGVAELARLESVLARKRHVGSNPTLSALKHAQGGNANNAVTDP